MDLQFRVQDRNIELLNLGGTGTGVISLCDFVLEECGRGIVGGMAGYIQLLEVEHLQAPRRETVSAGKHHYHLLYRR